MGGVNSVDACMFNCVPCFGSNRSVGVILYVLLSGVSPFLDESQEETCANIIKNDFCFPEEYFSEISNEAIDLIKVMLVDHIE